ncbi:MAG: hypothetical protein KDI15_13720, partial [Thiothrix sp.]|nr:hypothetical protein [Thiothrix sp.]
AENHEATLTFQVMVVVMVAVIVFPTPEHAAGLVGQSFRAVGMARNTPKGQRAKGVCSIG